MANQSIQRPLSGPPQTSKGSFSGPTFRPALTVMSINIEGFSHNKSEILSELSRDLHCDIVCVQETHRDTSQSRPAIPGLILVAETPHAKYGSAVFTRPGVSVVSTSSTIHNAIEIITIDTGNCTVTSVYKPPREGFQFIQPDNFGSRSTKIIVGDFNSHSTAWGYSETDDNGKAVEEWADVNGLTLIHSAKLPASFNSGRWKRGYNPDLIFSSSSVSSQTSKHVCQPIPRTQHRPILCTIQPAVCPINVPFRRRFNYTKANWEEFAKAVDERAKSLTPVAKNYDQFVNVVATASRKFIPRGCQTAYIPGLTRESADLLKQYELVFNNDPFSEETVQMGEHLLSQIGQKRCEKWMATITGIDMTHNSKKAWSTIRKLTCETPQASPPNLVTANQIAHQLLINGKPPQRLSKISKVQHHVEPTNDLSKPFVLADIILAMKALKTGKATGVDNISVEQIQHLGPVALSWLTQLFNDCIASGKVPRLWRKSKIIALLKPGKPGNDPKSYRPISLLCHTFKFFERLLLNRLTNLIDPKLIPDQAGFRPGKSCCNQTLHLTQHIEDGFEAGHVTGVVFVDLSAAYDTVNLKRLIWKVTSLTGDQAFIRILSELLYNRRFQVHLSAEKSRWRSQKNGLPQGSVLAPLLFNIYTNDQPSTSNTTRYIYADDLALASQAKSFEEVERNLSLALENLSEYYTSNALKPNPTKTQSCAFHLRNRQAHRTLDITWQGVPISHCYHPKYLGVVLDRSLTYKTNCEGVRKKVNSRNNLLQRLTSTKWGAAASVLRTTGLALCYSAGEYACPVWSRSVHAKLVDTALNETCRIITGCLKPTPLTLLYPLAGIAPPEVRREVASSVEMAKKECDPRHPMYGYKNTVTPRLVSRRSFLRSVLPVSGDPSKARVRKWKEKAPSLETAPKESLPPGHDLPRPTWKSLNRLRTQVGRCKNNLAKWGYIDSTKNLCECGASPQTMNHLLSCPACPSSCTPMDLLKATANAVRVAEYWADKI